MTVRVRLLGRPQLEVSSLEDRAPQSPVHGQKPWAVLARVALADRPLRRVDLTEELFGEANDPAGALRWTLADLRRGLALPDLLRGDPLTIEPLTIEPPTIEPVTRASGQHRVTGGSTTGASLWLDVIALEDGTLPDDQVGGRLLDGIELRDCPAFDLWLLMARSRCEVRGLEELRGRALRQLATGDSGAAVRLAEQAAAQDPLDESAQELMLRALVADGRSGLATARLAAVAGTFAREGLAVSPALRAAVQVPSARPPTGVRAGVVARSLLQAGRAALDAGAADGGIETLRRAAVDAGRSADQELVAEVLRALGSALVHAVRGFDGEGAVVLHRALVAARAADSPEVAADVLRELAFIDVQAGRHASAALALTQARQQADGLDDPDLQAGILALEGMNAADTGRHGTASSLLTHSVETARAAGRTRQQIWSQGVLARSLLLQGQSAAATAVAETSMSGAESQRWQAFLPWPQAIYAECLSRSGHWEQARSVAEQAFALACELGDPCWEGMAARALGLAASRDGDQASAWQWLLDARRRCDRVSDRYVWVSCYIGQAQLEVAARSRPEVVPLLATRLYDDARRADLPEFVAWALLHQARPDAPATVELARTAAGRVDNPQLRARAEALGR